jgi:arginase family enzyme
MSQDTDTVMTQSEAVAWSSTEGDERFADVVEVTTLDEVSQDVVLVGEPYDGGVVDRPGAREGPDAIRAALADLRTHHFDAGPVSSVGDLGDIDVPAGESVTAVQRQVREVAAAVHESDAIPVFLGGDGSLTGANVGPLLARQRANGGYVTDGGFGEDDEDVGEVEHFDPTGDASADDEDDTGELSADDEDTVSVEEEIVINGKDEPDAESGDEESTETGAESDEEHDDGEAPGAERDEEDAGAKKDKGATGTESDKEKADAESDEEGEGAEEGETEDEDDDDAEAESAEQTESGEADDETLGEVATIESASGERESAEDGPAERKSVERGSAEGESTERASAADGGTVGVVSLDAHLDCRAVDGQPSNATTYRQLFGAGLDALAVVGARHFESSTDEAEYLRELGGTVVTAEEVGEDAVVAADRALDALGDVDAVYVSVDLDVLDTTAAPGVSAPTPGGITTRELFRLLRVLASDDRLAGVEVVETAPPLCPDGRTARAGARAVAHALSVAGVGPSRS